MITEEKALKFFVAHPYLFCTQHVKKQGLEQRSFMADLKRFLESHEVVCASLRFVNTVSMAEIVSALYKVEYCSFYCTKTAANGHGFSYVQAQQIAVTLVG